MKYVVMFKIRDQTTSEGMFIELSSTCRHGPLNTNMMWSENKAICFIILSKYHKSWRQNKAVNKAQIGKYLRG